MNVAPVADGGDLVVVVAQITDRNGTVKRLNNEWVKFAVEGEAEIVGDGLTSINPAPVLWGEAGVILRTTTNPGEVKVTAQILLPGIHTAVSDTLTFVTQEYERPLLYDNSVYENRGVAKMAGQTGGAVIDSQSRQQAQDALKEVEQQQEDFGEQR